MKQATTQTYNSSIIDVENGAELIYLIDQDRSARQQIGLFPAPVQDLFPQRYDHAYRVLDLACGPGGWALEAAFQVPEVEVVGVDTADTMVRYATTRGHAQGTKNARFEVMDITKALNFPDASFQYIQARFLVGFLLPEHWPPLLLECRRLLAPGGFLCLTESEWSLTNSPAHEQLTSLTTQALKRSGHSLSPGGQHIGMTMLLPSFLREAGYESICSKTVALDWSAGTDLQTSFCTNCYFTFALLRPFLLRTGSIDEATFDQLYDTMLGEILSPTFCGLFTPLIAWGKKPATAHMLSA